MRRGTQVKRRKKGKGEKGSERERFRVEVSERDVHRERDIGDQVRANHPEVVDKDTRSMKMKGMKKGRVESRDSEK